MGVVRRLCCNCLQNPDSGQERDRKRRSASDSERRFVLIGLFSCSWRAFSAGRLLALSVFIAALSRTPFSRLLRLAGSLRLFLIQTFGSLRCLAFSSSSLLIAARAFAN